MVCVFVLEQLMLIVFQLTGPEQFNLNERAQNS